MIERQKRLTDRFRKVAAGEETATAPGALWGLPIFVHQRGGDGWDVIFDDAVTRSFTPNGG
jgi:hypothetical protein